MESRKQPYPSQTSPPGLENKKEELYTHIFKCVNYKGDYYADRYDCSFWKHRFNREWHTKNLRSSEKLELTQFA